MYTIMQPCPHRSVFSNRILVQISSCTFTVKRTCNHSITVVTQREVIRVTNECPLQSLVELIRGVRQRVAFIYERHRAVIEYVWRSSWYQVGLTIQAAVEERPPATNVHVVPRAERSIALQYGLAVNECREWGLCILTVSCIDMRILFRNRKVEVLVHHVRRFRIGVGAHPPVFTMLALQVVRHTLEVVGHSIVVRHLILRHLTSRLVGVEHGYIHLGRCQRCQRCGRTVGQVSGIREVGKSIQLVHLWAQRTAFTRIIDVRSNGIAIIF